MISPEETWIGTYNRGGQPNVRQIDSLRGRLLGNLALYSSSHLVVTLSYAALNFISLVVS
jgi:hypothetical protein